MNTAQKRLLFYVGLAFSLLAEMWFLWWTVIYPSAVWNKPIWIFADLANFLLLVISTLAVGIFACLSEYPDALQISWPKLRRKPKTKRKDKDQKRPLF